jgi:hypothetical protein
MQIKLKTGIIMLVCGIIFGSLGTGCGLYIYFQKSMGKVNELNIRYKLDKLETDKRIADLKDTNRQLEINYNKLRKSYFAISESNKKSIDYSIEIDKRCRELSGIIKEINGIK